MKVHELLSDKSKWTKEAYCRNSDGDRVGHNDGSPLRFVSDPVSVCWCLEGALVRCYGDGEKYRNIVNKIRTHLGIWCIPEWNDAAERTYDDVIELCKELDI